MKIQGIVFGGGQQLPEQLVGRGICTEYFVLMANVNLLLIACRAKAMDIGAVHRAIARPIGFLSTLIMNTDNMGEETPKPQRRACTA